MNSKNKFLSLLLILLGLIVFVVFTKNQFYNLQSNLDLRNLVNTEYKQKTDELTKLQELKKSLTAGENKDVEKYIMEFNEDELINYFYSYAQDVSLWDGKLVIRSLNMDKGTINEYGFNEGTISLEVRVADEGTLLKMLDFLTGKDSKYSFFIDNFTYTSSPTWSFTATIPLKVFYK